MAPIRRAVVNDQETVDAQTAVIGEKPGKSPHLVATEDKASNFVTPGRNGRSAPLLEAKPGRGPRQFVAHRSGADNPSIFKTRRHPRRSKKPRQLVRSLRRKPRRSITGTQTCRRLHGEPAYHFLVTLRPVYQLSNGPSASTPVFETAQLL